MFSQKTMKGSKLYPIIFNGLLITLKETICFALFQLQNKITLLSLLNKFEFGLNNLFDKLCCAAKQLINFGFEIDLFVAFNFT